MKIPIYHTAKLQQRIDRHVRAIQRAGEVIFYDGGSEVPAVWGKLRDVYAAVREAGRPVDYRYVTWAMGKPPDKTHYWRSATRLGWLVKRGYLRKAGRGPRRYTQHGATLFVAVEPEDIPIVRQRIDDAIQRMLKDIEPFAARVAIGPCLARRIEDNHRPSANGTRNSEIIRLRLDGMKLDDIGEKFGITRERARQIVERAATPLPVGLRTLKYMQETGYHDKYGNPVRPNRHTRAVLLDVAMAILRMEPKDNRWQGKGLH